VDWFTLPVVHAGGRKQLLAACVTSPSV